MAAASYTTDLNVLHTMETTPTSGEFTGYATGGTPAVDTDYPVQGTQHLSATMTKTGLCSIAVDNGANITWTSGWAFFVWGTFLPAAACQPDANGGLQVLVGADLSNFRAWYVGGNDFGRYPYGGWQNFAVDPQVTAQATTGNPGTSYRWVGFGVDVATAVARGNPIGMDAVRYGRGSLIITNGDVTNGYGTFLGAASTNDTSANRWGLLTLQAGSFLWKGRLSLGTDATAVDFRDSNRNIVVDNTRRVTSAFNLIEVRNASSRVDWTNINITALGTVAKGDFTQVAAADVNFDTCVFTDMGVFTFLSSAAIVGCTFRRCSEVAGGGAPFTACTFSASTGQSAISVTNLSQVSDCSFVRGATGHAVNLGTVSATTTMSWNCTLSGYAGTDGSTGNEAIRVNVASGQTLTINVASGASTPSIYNTGTGTVNVVAGLVTTTITVRDVINGDPLTGARVFLYAANGTGDMPYQDSVTIANSGTTATVTHNAHGMQTGDKVWIRGASHAANNGVFTITVTNANTYTYTLPSAPGSSPTGTITSTWVAIYAITDSNGQVTMSRSFSTSQPITGWARKATA